MYSVGQNNFEGYWMWNESRTTL